MKDHFVHNKDKEHFARESQNQIWLRSVKSDLESLVHSIQVYPLRQLSFIFFICKMGTKT